MAWAVMSPITAPEPLLLFPRRPALWRVLPTIAMVISGSESAPPGVTMSRWAGSSLGAARAEKTTRRENHIEFNFTLQCSPVQQGDIQTHDRDHSIHFAGCTLGLWARPPTRAAHRGCPQFRQEYAAHAAPHASASPMEPAPRPMEWPALQPTPTHCLDNHAGGACHPSDYDHRR
jgi:hypothetical protein